MPHLRLRLNLDDLESRVRQVQQNPVRHILFADLRLPPVQAGELRDKGLLLVRLAGFDAEKIVRLRLEVVDLALPLYEKPERDRLDAPGRKRPVIRAVDALPQERRDLVADDAV